MRIYCFGWTVRRPQEDGFDEKKIEKYGKISKHIEKYELSKDVELKGCLIYVSYSDILYILMFSVLIVVGLEFLDFFVGFGILTQFSWF